jgi:hypothetical protein
MQGRPRSPGASCQSYDNLIVKITDVNNLPSNGQTVTSLRHEITVTLKLFYMNTLKNAVSFHVRMFESITIAHRDARQSLNRFIILHHLSMKNIYKKSKLMLEIMSHGEFTINQRIDDLKRCSLNYSSLFITSTTILYLK